MPDPIPPEWTDDEQAATRFYTNFLSYAAQRLTTSQLWAAVRDLGETEGQAPPGITFRVVNRLRSLAVGQRNAAADFAAAQTDDLITPNMFANTPWSAPEEVQRYTENRYVLVPVSDREGNQSFRTFKYGAFNPLPATKGALLEDLQGMFEDQYPGTGLEPNLEEGVQILTGPAWIPHPTR